MRDTRYEIGSALILAVVLTSLLAIVGVMFLMVARVNRMATSGISENKELNFAVETVIAKISQELVLDTPEAVDPNQDYYDYPIHRLDPGPDGITGTADDALFDPGLDGIYGTVDDIPVTGVLDDYWLANLEPEIVDVGGDMGLPPDMDFGFRHITDLYGRLAYLFQDSFNYSLNSVEYTDPDGDRISFRNMRAKIIASALPIQNEGDKADADGDGVADSRWIKLPNMNSSKGKPIFAAIRIIDNGGMLNVNTAHKFDPNDPTVTADDIDGSSQMQINLAALSQRGANGMLVTAANKLQVERCGIMPTDLSLYEQNVVWRYNAPVGTYTPFDISDELELRNRFLINLPGIDTRIEEVWDNVFQVGKRTPFDSDIPDWFDRAQFDISEPNKYSYRHIGTNYNMDRIIDPNGGKMVNVNRINPIAEPNITDLYNAIRTGLEKAGVTDPNNLAAQIAVNIVDYRDADSDITVYNGHYGFERPCVYISELAHNFVPDPNDPNIVYRSYAIELYKPYSEDAVTADWWIDVDGTSINIGSWPQTKDFYVIQNQDPNGVAILDVNSNSAAVQDSTKLVFGGNSQIRLQRFVADVNDYIVVDYRQVPDPVGDWLAEDGNDHSIRRDITLHKCIRRLWSGPLVDSTLGQSNNYPPDPDPDPNMIQAHPTNAGFPNIGEVGMIFREDVYGRIWNSTDTEIDVRLNLADPIFQQIFNYLTVFDPADHIFDPNETRIKGRININTAPWFVIAQLPWVSQRINEPLNYYLAQAIVAYRDKTFVLGGPDYIGRLGEKGFRSIGELNNVVSGGPNYRMDYYALDPNDLQGFPDLTPNDGDGARGNFEERDVIFARISNLVTVRSDVFTAYILVRIGVDGPQKRAIAILDRSNVYSSDGKVRIVALHPVPDPR